MELALGRGMRAWMLAVAFACAFFAHAHAASATTYCVYKTPDQCPAEPGQSFATVQEAFAAAAISLEPDTIEVRPGQHALGAGAAYTGLEAVDVVGAGPTTQLVHDGPGTALSFGTADGSKVRSLSLSIPAGAIGIDFGGNGTVSDVAIGQAGDSETANAIGIRAGAALVVQRVVATLEDSGSAAVIGNADPLRTTDIDFLVEDSSLVAKETAISSDGHPLTIQRSTLSAADTVVLGGASATIDNSVVVKKEAPGAAPFRLQNVPEIRLVNATVADQTGSLDDPAITVSTTSTTNLITQETVFSGFERVVDPVTGGGELTRQAENEELFSSPAPDFVNAAAGNFNLRADSVLIDRAPAAGPTAVDRAGRPRSVDVHGEAGDRPRDIGAFEFQPHAPTVALTASRTTASRGQSVTFTAAAADPDPGENLIFLWSFDGSAPVRGGPVQTRAFPTYGVHTAAVTVVDRSRRTAGARAIVIVPAPKPPTGPRPGVCLNQFNGTTASDTITGSRFGDAMIGGAGNDTLRGVAGDDCLLGDEGNDRLFGGSGGDMIRGLAGADLVDGGTGDDSLSGGSAKDRLVGGSGKDLLSGGGGPDRLKGGSSRDSLTGGSGKDSFDAGAGDDKLSTRDGVRELVNCGSGRDSVSADRIDKLIGCEKKKRR